MARRLFESEKALADVDGIWDQIANEIPSSASPLAADRVAAAIRSTYGRIARFPDNPRIQGRDLFRTTVDGFRQYVVVYRFDDKSVEILRVFRCDLDWTRVVLDL